MTPAAIAPVSLRHTQGMLAASDPGGLAHRSLLLRLLLLPFSSLPLLLTVLTISIETK